MHCYSVCSGMCSVTSVAMAMTLGCDIICHHDTRLAVGTERYPRGLSVCAAGQSEALRSERPLRGQRSDGGLGKGHPEVLVVVQLVVVKGDQSLNGFLHRSQLHQRHLPILPVTSEEVTSSPTTHQKGGRGKEYINTYKKKV